MKLKRSAKGNPERQNNLTKGIARLPSSLTGFCLSHSLSRKTSTEPNQATSSMILRFGSGLNHLAIDLELFLG